MTPVEFQSDKLAEGQIVAVLKTELPTDKLRLPPGQYNLFVVRVGQEWRCYAESKGTIAPQAMAVNLNSSKSNRSVAGSEGGRKPEIQEQAGRFKITVYCKWSPTECTITIEF